MVDLDRRTYDLLRLVRAEGPIGSIRLTDLMERHGYTIQGRTIRLTLADLDEAGLTEKVPGRGRRLTDRGRRELERGDVTGRLEQVRERIATLTDRVTYDPIEDVGTVVTSAVTVPGHRIDAALDRLRALDDSPLGPVRGAVEAVDGDGDGDSNDDAVRFVFPSSITVEGVLLARGIPVDLQTAGLVEYRADDGRERGGAVERYVDAISGTDSTVDVVTLLIEAGRTDVAAALDGAGTLIVDNYEFPISRLGECLDLTAAMREHIGGVLDVRRPREDGPFPGPRPNFDFASLTYGGIGELAVALLVEGDHAASWRTLAGTEERGELRAIEHVASVPPLVDR
ncbi:NrpR regulatory domain-containing protein [Halarchaeum nitratireducens]|nr:NrpR regulatory domain-containing protein [Halarchaeum nitratireducens]